MVIQHGISSPGTRQTTSKSTSRKQTLTSSEDRYEPQDLRRSYEAAREEARLILEGEHERLRTLRQQEARRQYLQQERRRKEEERVAEEARQRQAEADAQRETEATAKREAKLKRARAKQKPSQQAEDLKNEDEANAPTTPGVQPDSEGSGTPKLVIGGLSPSKHDKQGHHRRASSAVEKLRLEPKGTHSRANSTSQIAEISESEPMIHKPNFDAPISAVNAGERRVGVRFKEALITLPVTPSTTAKDILNSTSLCMSEPFDPRTSVLLESFSQIGLERPLRRYERIRDVMNSWDNDSQNHLFVMSGSDCAAPGLQVADAPNYQPSEITVHIYHSQKPGKWEKRWLKLREDGQITTSKSENGGDSTNICHVSDFDLYTPTAKQMKKLKPPKKLCYAFKSQEKSAMFLDTANFVHFFCTKDKLVADRWYHAVHSWRSWYLVNMLGEGVREEEPAEVRLPLGHRPGTSNANETLPYVLGSFKPLDFGSSFEPGRKPDLSFPHRSSESPDRRPLIDFVAARPSIDGRPASPKFASKLSAGPPSAFPRKLMIDSATNGNTEIKGGPFTGSGLMARSASRRAEGGSRTGHGVSAEDGKPLVDIAPMSEFTDGSLLRRMESIAARQGAFEPTIDRQKRREVDVAVGEGF